MPMLVSQEVQVYVKQNEIIRPNIFAQDLVKQITLARNPNILVALSKPFDTSRS